MPPVPVLLLCQALTQGGSERQLCETARNLDPQRFEVHVGCLRPGGIRTAELLARNIPVTVFPLRSFAGPQVLTALGSLARYILNHKISLVHSFDTPMNVIGVLAGRLARAPVVLSSQRAFRELAPFPFRHLLRLTDLLADAVVVNCRALARHLAEDERVPASRIRLCYNGVDASIFQPGAGPRPEALAGEALTVGCVCALRPEKSLETLVAAFARIVRPGLRLAITGDGPMREPLERMAAGLGIAGQCVFQPGTAAVAPWLAAFDVFVLPSRSEALSNSLMEAMACGCAVIASDVGGNPELVDPGHTGLLFESGNVTHLAAQLNRLCTDPSLRRRLASNASHQMRTGFSMAAAVSRMQEIYLSALRQAATQS
jgi:glycosyltransferase involved in cell wall biosynthesis